MAPILYTPVEIALRSIRLALMVLAMSLLLPPPVQAQDQNTCKSIEDQISNLRTKLHRMIDLKNVSDYTLTAPCMQLRDLNAIGPCIENKRKERENAKIQDPVLRKQIGEQLERKRSLGC